LVPELNHAVNVLERGAQLIGFYERLFLFFVSVCFTSNHNDKQNQNNRIKLKRCSQTTFVGIRRYSMKLNLDRTLFESSSGITLGLFRIFFGIIMAIEFYKLRPALVGMVNLDVLRFTYDYFHWIEPLPAFWLNVFFWGMVFNSLLFSAGIYYRVSSVFQFLGFFYVFHLERSFYNNHFYLFILVAFIMIFCNGEATLSLNSWKNGAKPIPKWNLLAVQLQLFILYFYGGIAKLNPEWLFYAQPVKSWLPNMLNNFLGTEDLSAESITTMSFVVAYSGLVIDLLAGPLLFWKRTRPYMMTFLVVFHLMNSQMFHIGLFPWFGIGSLVLFVDVDKIPFNSVNQQISRELPIQNFRPMVKALFITYFIIQCLIPLRHWIMPGWSMWNERGFMFSWFMKLRTKLPIDSMKVRFEGDPKDYYVEYYDYILPDQAEQMAFTPFMMVQFAHKLEERLKKTNNTDVDIQVYIEVYAKLHDHPYQLMIDPKQDLTQVSYKQVGLFEKADWIYEFNPNAIEPDFDFLNAKKKLQE
jgi:vitamin K-dependent gamma-carboxylase